MFLSTSSIRSSLTTIAVLGALRQPPPLAILNNYTLTQRYRISSLIFIFLPFFVTFFSLFCLVFFALISLLHRFLLPFQGVARLRCVAIRSQAAPLIMTGRGSPRRAHEHREAPNPRMPRPKPCFSRFRAHPLPDFICISLSLFLTPFTRLLPPLSPASPRRCAAGS